MKTDLKRTLFTVDEASRLVALGTPMLAAGSEEALRALPCGRWIGGTIPYFMGDAGGCYSTDQVFVTDLAALGTTCSIRFYDEQHLPEVMVDAPANGFSVAILPFDTAVHRRYAEDAAEYEGMFVKPIIGWIAGTALAEIGKVTPKVFNGETGESSETAAIVMHVALPADKIAQVEMVNIFSQGTGDTLTFPTTGFEIETCYVNGTAQSFAEYLVEHEIDTRLPLVAEYNGAMINTSIQTVDRLGNVVRCFAPVFPDVEYRLASPVPDYEQAFKDALVKSAGEAIFSCNCILNYVYGGLEGKQIGLKGPITFGEIAYQLVNQTLVYLAVWDRLSSKSIRS